MKSMTGAIWLEIRSHALATRVLITCGFKVKPQTSAAVSNMSLRKKVQGVFQHELDVEAGAFTHKHIIYPFRHPER